MGNYVPAADSVLAWIILTGACWYGVIRFFIAIANAYEQYKKDTSSDIW